MALLHTSGGKTFPTNWVLGFEEDSYLGGNLLTGHMLSGL